MIADEELDMSTVSVSAMEPSEAASYDFQYLGYLLRC
jgi:hypothetical protein